MNQYIQFKTKTILTILFLLGTLVVQAQQANLLYYMPGVPQIHQLNPASQPWCKFYLGFPGLSPIQFGIENSAFGLNNLIWTENGEIITFLHPNADKDEFLKKFKKANYIGTDASSTLMSIGFRSKKLYNTIELTQKSFARVSFPGDLIQFALKGNDEVVDSLGTSQLFDFSTFGANALSYLELAFGVGHQINDKLTLGYKTKILFGQANLTTKKTDITLTTGEDWIIHSEFEANAALPGIDIPQEGGEFKFEDITQAEDLNANDYVNMFTGNFGLGIDLGMHYKPIDNLTISASLIDLGYIKWSNFTYSISQNVDTTFSGLIYNSWFDDSVSIEEETAEAFKNTFNSFTSSVTSYSSYLPAKLYIGAKYQLIKEISFSILSRSEFYKGRMRQQFTIATQLYPIKMVAATFGYTIMNNTYNNLGFGLALKAGPFNLYFLSDNIPLVYARYKDSNSNIIIPYNKRQFNFRFGLNLVFGCKSRAKKKTSDLPLIY